MLQLVGIIAMAFLSSNSIGFRCNYLVLLQLYWIWLLLLVTIATIIMGCIMFHGVAIARVVITTRFPNGCNSMFLLPWFSGVVIIFCGVAIVKYLLQLQS